MKYTYFFYFIFFALLTSACSPREIDNPSPQLVSLSVTPVNGSIAPGTTAQFTATGHYSNSTQLNLTTAATWSSLNAGIATISNTSGSKGLAVVTAATGSTIISATVSGITGTTILTSSPVSTMTVTSSVSSSMAPGTTRQFSAFGTLQDATVQDLTTWATWTSLNSSIAFVSNASGSKGLATAVDAPGSAGIQASYNGVPNAATLTTSHVASIAITPGSKSIPNGTSEQFSAMAILVGDDSQDITTFATWTTAAPVVATISNSAGSRGLAAAVSVGSTDVLASFDSVTSPPAALTVTTAVLQSITFTPANPSIALGKSQPFIATGHYSGNTTQDITSSVTWHSSNTSIATISNAAGSKGIALSLAQGTTTITATLSGITSSASTLTVTPAELVSITITPASASIPNWTTKKFSATGIFTNGSSQDVSTTVHWNSSATSVATISNTAGFEGVATPATLFSTGSTNITATLSPITSNTAVLTVTSF